MERRSSENSLNNTLPKNDFLVKGLSETEVLKKRRAGEGNLYKLPVSRSYRQIFSENVFTFLNIVLFGLGIILVILGRFSDALVSVGVISINVLVNVIQEIKAKRTLDKIALISKPNAKVIRDGKEKTVELEELVKGDLIVLNPGDEIVADGVLMGDDVIQLDESLLTGESELVSRSNGDRTFSGSLCISGSSIYKAENLGESSLSNIIVKSARSFRRTQTPLQKEVNLIIRILLFVAIFLEIILFIDFLLEKTPLVEFTRMSVVILGLVPNGLFLAIASAYALAILKIAKQGALIQQSNAIESLSHINTLCLDKTGTITTNNLFVKEFIPNASGNTNLTQTLGDFAASFKYKNKTANALIDTYKGTKVSIKDAVPFSSENRWSGLIFNDDKRKGIYVLGAPEIILSNIKNRNNHNTDIETRQNKGLRVLAFAHSNDTSLKKGLKEVLLPSSLTLLGLVVLEDEIRKDAKLTVNSFFEAGVELKIISGDNLRTVESLVKQAGIKLSGGSISGEELANLDPDKMRQEILTNSVFGRISPEQKEQIIQILQNDKKYVAMIGDGINDVRALKRSDLAISLKDASQAARAVSDIILIEDSFTVLPKIVQEGQRILNGMQDVFKIFLTRILYSFLLITATGFNGSFPLSPKHNSLLTFLTVGIPTLALVAWAKPGRASNSRMIKKIMHFILPPGITLGLAGLLIFVINHVIPSMVTGEFSLFNQIGFVSDFLSLLKAQSALTTFLILCGLMLIVFVEPPSSFFAGGDKTRNDIKPLFLTVFLFISFTFILVDPSLSDFFEMSYLPYWNFLILLALSLLWGVLIIWLWRKKFFDRYLGIEE